MPAPAIEEYAVVVPVVILDPAPTFRRGLAHSLTTAGFCSEEPSDLCGWAVGPERRAILVTVRASSGWGPLLALAKFIGKVIVIALLIDPTCDAYREAIRIGADGAADWHAEPELIADVVLAAYNGQLLIPLAAARSLIHDHGPSGNNSISPEEREWLGLIAGGMPVYQLADKAGYSERAIYRRLASLYKRIGVAGRTEAIVYASQRGLLPYDTASTATISASTPPYRAAGLSALAFGGEVDRGRDLLRRGRI